MATQQAVHVPKEADNPRSGNWSDDGELSLRNGVLQQHEGHVILHSTGSTRSNESVVNRAWDIQCNMSFILLRFLMIFVPCLLPS